MRLHIQGKNIKVTRALQAYVNQKIGKATKHCENLMTQIDVTLSAAPHPYRMHRNLVEVTVYANGKVLRAEEYQDSLFACIDVVADKLSRQLDRYKEKRQR